MDWKHCIEGSHDHSLHEELTPELLHYTALRNFLWDLSSSR
jgi:hypothetical protein